MALFSRFCFAIVLAFPLNAQLVRMHTNAGDIDVQLLPASAPATVANFLNYANRGAYNNSLIHRSVPGFIIQGGGYTPTAQVIPTDPPVVNEFKLSNVRGTIAMAKLGGNANSATDQWFFNLADNSANLDNQNGGFTVFGMVANQASLTVMDQIAALPRVNAGAPFDQLPVFSPPPAPVSGNNLVTVISVTQSNISAIALNSTSSQSTTISTAFPAPLQVFVTNGGMASAGVAVTFTLPASGPGGSFFGSRTVTTNASGIAVAPALIANNVPGTYTVTASVNALTTSFTLTNTPLPTNVGVFSQGYFVLDSNSSGGYDPGDKYFFYANQPGDIALFGDWNGDGRTKVGVYRSGFWVLDYNGNGIYDPPADKIYGFGGPTNQGYVPIVGDWNGDGRSKVGYYLRGFWVLDYNGNGMYDGMEPGQDKFYAFGGGANEYPLVGDWNRDGRTKIGNFSNGTFTLDYDGDGGYTASDKQFVYVSYTADDRPLVGDWNGDGRTKIGIYRKGFWVLDYNGNNIYESSIDKFYGFGGNTGELPVVGDWNGDGRSKVGVYLDGFWALDYNGNGGYDGIGPGQDRFIGYGGAQGEQPIIGKW